MDPKLMALLAKGLGLEDATEESVAAKLAEAGIEDGKLFTQKDVNAFLAENKRTLRKDRDDLQKSLAAIQHELASLKTGGKSTSADGDDDDDLTDDNDTKSTADQAAAVDKATALEIKRLRKQFQQTQAELQAERKKAQDATQRALDGERDRLLVAEGQKLRMKDPSDALAYFRASMTQENGKWIFLDADGTPADSIAAGLADALKAKPYLIEPANTGGSGAGGGTSANPLKDATAKLEAAQKAFAADPSNNILGGAVLRAQREVRAAQEGQNKK